MFVTTKNGLPLTRMKSSRISVVIPGLEEIPKTIALTCLNRAVGIEIECENVVSPGDLLDSDLWITVQDASLRGDSTEWVTRYGLRVHDMIRALDHIKTCTEQVKVMLKRTDLYNFSERTSIHVHLDSRFFNEEQIRSLIILYTLVENPLFKFAGVERRHNIFCVPLRESQTTVINGDLWSMTGNWHRYCAINLLSLSSFGTVEFRHMEGNLDIKRIFTWVMLLSLLHTAASRMTLKEVQDLVVSIKGESHYQISLESIFFGYTKYLEYDEQDIDRACSDAKLFFGEA